MKRYHTHKPQLRLLKRLGGRIARLRHLRGHGVHSPYIYGIVREVFMRRNIITPQLAGIESCRTMSRRMVIELQNLYTYCGYRSYLIDPPKDKIAEFIICSTECPISDIEAICQLAAKHDSTVVIESPMANSDREHLCNEIIDSHQSTIVDKSRYIIIFNNHLPKQHFKL